MTWFGKLWWCRVHSCQGFGVPSRVFPLVSRLSLGRRGQLLLRSLLLLQSCLAPLLPYRRHRLFQPHNVSHTFPYRNSTQVKRAGVLVFCCGAPWFLICSRGPTLLIRLRMPLLLNYYQAERCGGQLPSLRAGHLLLCSLICLRRSLGVFHLDRVEKTAAKLLSLCQGSTLVANYSIQFRILATVVGMTLWRVYIKGRVEELKDKLVGPD